MGAIGTIIIAIIVIALIIAMLPLALAIGIILLALWLILKIYENYYFKSDKFLKLKEDNSKYIKECNELNEHIMNLKNCYATIEHIDYGKADITDNSKFNYKRKENDKYQYSKFVYNCSIQVCRNSQEQPFKYLCKYFNIPITEESLNNFEEMLNNYSSVEDGKNYLKGKYDLILNNNEEQIPKIIKKHCSDRLYKELNLKKFDFDDVYFPTYTFQYISAGGNSSMKSTIQLNISNLNKLIKYLDDNIKWKKSVKGQRALMTTSLRREIKKRDNYTCQICGNSIIKEPNLLLEIDHKIPLSKGGMTTEDNLQTLCWRCNRTKGSKIID